MNRKVPEQQVKNVVYAEDFIRRLVAQSTEHNECLVANQQVSLNESLYDILETSYRDMSAKVNRLIYLA